MKLFTATFGTESNTFAPLPTNRDSFRALIHLSAEQATAAAPMLKQGTLGAFLALQDEFGIEPAFGLTSYAQPGGPTTRETYEAMRDELLNDLRAAMPLDGVLLHLHGAMVADGYEDPEGDILERARVIAGADTVIGLLIDPHCHLSDAMVENADLIMCYKEYPHTDVDDRSLDITRLVARAVRGDIKPAMSVFDCRMIAGFHTTKEPMKGLVADMVRYEQEDDLVLNVSVAHGFPWGDVAAMGTKVIVVSDNAPGHGETIAEKLGKKLWDMREDAGGAMLSVEETVAKAREATAFPVVIADSSDNPGGGAPSDSTHLVRAMLEAGLTRVAAAYIWDPVAVDIAHKAGEGARLEMRIGGKTSPLCGEPLNLSVAVKTIGDNLSEDFASVKWNTGPFAAVEADGVTLVLITERVQCFSPEAFRKAGVEPESQRFLIVKSSQHFHAGFAPIAADILYADPPGVVTHDLTSLTYKKIARPKWPFDADPWA